MEKEKMEQAKKLAEEIGELEQMSDVENMIKNNIIEFSLDNRDVKYRVRLPVYEEQIKLEKFRRAKYLEFVQDNNIKFQKEWIKIYKDKGIDILEMEEKVISLTRQMQEKQLKLAETSEEIRVEKLKEEILTLRKEISELQLEKTDLLSYSLEDLLLTEVCSFMVYLVLEKLVEDNKWVKVYETYEDASKTQDSVLFNKSFYYSSFLQTQHLN
jgi:hypothetical protein